MEGMYDVMIQDQVYMKTGFARSFMLACEYSITS